MEKSAFKSNFNFFVVYNIERKNKFCFAMYKLSKYLKQNNNVN